MDGAAATDRFGMPAFVCAADGRALESVPDSPDVVRCPACGHRTDTPGDGTLADGFDVVHRQWGLRGDPHAWRAMRDAVAGTPTPSAPADVRAAYAGALRRVADVDVDGIGDERTAYRADLDHGGMSGGVVDVDWWRTKGIPLLVDRAIARRPTPAATAPPDAAGVPGRRHGRARKTVVTVAVWALVLAIPASLVGGGAFLLYQRAVGTHVRATVLTCDTSGTVTRGASTYRTECIAEWTIDGRTVVGPFVAGDGDSDEGKTLDATVRGGTAYSRSLGLPILLLVLGIPFLAIPCFGIRDRVRRART